MVIKSRMEGKNVKIIYEDTEKLIVEKPAGVLTQSARSFDTDLVSEVLTYRRSKKETPPQRGRTTEKQHMRQLLTGWTDRLAGWCCLQRQSRRRRGCQRKCSKIH